MGSACTLYHILSVKWRGECQVEPWIVYSDSDRLTCHEGFISANKIWIKMGGDHGGRSFKVALQTLNLRSLNTKENTIATMRFEGKDSDENLHRMVGSQRDAVKQLRHMAWRKKQVKLYLFGNYAFLSNMHGLSGVQGTFLCLWRLIPTAEMQIELGVWGRSISRKLSTIKQGHHQFKTKEQRQLCTTSSSESHSGMYVPVRCIFPLYLHILLGIVKRHQDLIEAECHQLHIANVAKDVAKTTAPLSDHLFQLCRDINQLQQQKQAEVCISCLPISFS